MASLFGPSVQTKSTENLEGSALLQDDFLDNPPPPKMNPFEEVASKKIKKVDIQVQDDFDEKSGDFTFSMAITMNAMILRLTMSVKNCIEIGYIKDHELTSFVGKVLRNLLITGSYGLTIDPSFVTCVVGQKELIQVVMKIPRTRFETEFIPCKQVISAEYICELLNQIQAWKQKATQVTNVHFSGYEFIEKTKSRLFCTAWSYQTDSQYVDKIKALVDVDPHIVPPNTWEKRGAVEETHVTAEALVYLDIKLKKATGLVLRHVNGNAYSLSGHLWQKTNKISWDKFRAFGSLHVAYSKQLEKVYMESHPFYVEMMFYSSAETTKIWGEYAFVVKNGFLTLVLMKLLNADGPVVAPVELSTYVPPPTKEHIWSWNFYDESHTESVSKPTQWTGFDVCVQLHKK